MVQITRPREAAVTEFELPEIGSGQVRLRTRRRSRTVGALGPRGDGLDDDIFAPLTRSALTTIELDAHGLARHLRATAQDWLAEAPEPHPYVMDACIVERASVTNPV